jgi:CheY-like chemotaxis protein
MVPAWMIEMTMDEISAKPIDRSEHRYLSATSVVNKAVAEFCYTNAEDKNRISVMPNQDFVFRGDETRFVFTLFNLLKNATYYFDKHPKARVTITVNHRIVTVEDTGPGIKPEVISRLFEAFHSEGKQGGTGLGLSFCQRTMRAFGGAISCESVYGEFTRFVMRFPHVAENEISAHEEGVKRQGVAMFSGRRILVVDDSRHFRQMPKKALIALGAQVDEAEDGNQALAKLDALPTPQASAAVHALIDVARLDSLRRLGLIKADLAHALEDMRTKFGQLAGYVAANDMGRAKTLMHALMGLAGHLGARAFHDELRARYALMVETGQWPADGDWLLKLRQLFTDTDRLLRARTGV